MCPTTFTFLFSLLLCSFSHLLSVGYSQMCPTLSIFCFHFHFVPFTFTFSWLCLSSTTNLTYSFTSAAGDNSFTHLLIYRVFFVTGAPLKILSIENLYKTRQKKIKLGLRCLLMIFLVILIMLLIFPLHRCRPLLLTQLIHPFWDKTLLIICDNCNN